MSRFIKENTEFAKSLLGQDDRLNIGSTNFGEDYLKETRRYHAGTRRTGLFSKEDVYGIQEIWGHRKFRQATGSEIQNILMRDPTERARARRRQTPGTSQIASNPLTSSVLLGN